MSRPLRCSTAKNGNKSFSRTVFKVLPWHPANFQEAGYLSTPRKEQYIVYHLLHTQKVSQAHQPPEAIHSRAFF